MTQQPKMISMLLILCSLLVSGCAHNITISVNAIVDKTLSSDKKLYFLASGLNETTGDDLYFQEYRRYFDHILTTKGYIKTDILTEADILIVFKYGLSDGRSGYYTYSTPVYDYVGGETITITEPPTTGTSKAKVTTIHIPPRFERIGTSMQSRSYTHYNRTASLKALLINKDSIDKESRDKDSRVLWQIHIYSVGESGDLRSIMPYLAAAAEPYVGGNSGEQRSITLTNEAPSVIKFKNLQ
jgi:hypothetical protein